MQGLHPTLQDQDTSVMNPNSADMGVLANTAEGKSEEENIKHPGEFVKWGAAMDAPIWGSLTTQVYFLILHNLISKNPLSRKSVVSRLYRYHRSLV